MTCLEVDGVGEGSVRGINERERTQPVHADPECSSIREPVKGVRDENIESRL